MNPTIPAWWRGAGRALWALAAILLAASLGAITRYAPTEVQMGIVQKIVYVHVPSATMTLLAFGLTFAGSIAYLATKQWAWDALAAASCELGMVFATVVMVTGPLWARSAWNTWWTWEPRLTTFLILWILYAGYHVVRSSIRSSSKRTVSSILGIVLFVNLPVVWMSIQWWRGSLHPRNVTMTGEMRTTLLLSMAAWMVFFAAALLTRLRLEWIREEALERDLAGARAPETGRAGA
ncbi:MAG TPA: cytochrome c biogenesis protein [Candidatus Eisenbacteria bacterium]